MSNSYKDLNKCMLITNEFCFQAKIHSLFLPGHNPEDNITEVVNEWTNWNVKFFFSSMQEWREHEQENQ